MALAARKIEKLGALCRETGAHAYACNAADPDEVERLFGLVEREIAAPDLVVYNASGRSRGAFVDLVPSEVAQCDCGQRLWRLPGGAAGGETHAAEQARRDPVHGRVGEREGLCAIGAVRDGQVRAAGTGAKHGARIVAAGHPCRAFRHRRRHPQRHPARSAGEAGFVPRSRCDRDRVTGMYCSSRAAPGPGNWNCGPGWRSFEYHRHCERSEANPAILRGSGFASLRSQ